MVSTNFKWIDPFWCTLNCNRNLNVWLNNICIFRKPLKLIWLRLIPHRHHTNCQHFWHWPIILNQSKMNCVLRFWPHSINLNRSYENQNGISAIISVEYFKSIQNDDGDSSISVCVSRSHCFSKSIEEREKKTFRYCLPCCLTGFCCPSRYFRCN